MDGCSQHDGMLVRQHAHETLWIQPWGADSFRVRATRQAEIIDPSYSALLPAAPIMPMIEIHADQAIIRNGKLEARVSADSGRIRFYRTDTGEEVLSETWTHPTAPSLTQAARYFKANGSDLFRIEAFFEAYEGERIYGLGQHKHALLDQKGCELPLYQRNSEINIPFLVSNRRYGFLWNNPALGRVTTGRTSTHWVADASRQLDYWITVGDSFADIMAHYADATGHAPMLPEFAAGFWQSRLRYVDQEQLLSVAREYKKRGLPLSVIMVDFFHWVRQGEWDWDYKRWPDPAAMVQELKEMGVEVLASVWPTVNPNCHNAAEMRDRGLLVSADHGLPLFYPFWDTYDEGNVFLHYYDPTNPEARQYLWEKIKQHYYDIGIKVFWLDSGEPDVNDPWDRDNFRYHLGAGAELTNIYPQLNAQTFYDGLSAAGEPEIITLNRSAWAGSQRYGAAVWSGDIPSTFASLRQQIRAGLNIAMSGIPWWTSDTGGFYGGNIHDPEFRELIVRWFQYSAFCPLFRLHGDRDPKATGEISGADNEVWSFGDEAYAILKDYLFLREHLRGYVMEQMRLASEQGTPPMRPLFFDFADDQTAYDVEDEFLFGPDILVAPVAECGARSRRVYLPAGTAWTDAWTGEQFDGGQWRQTDAPLARIPIYLRGEATLPGLIQVFQGTR